ncbi:MAG: hypothetical protein QOE76_352 [Frankiales bacterium]|nr:hypothetical protein [Frankiales bacterium]
MSRQDVERFACKSTVGRAESAPHWARPGHAVESRGSVTLAELDAEVEPELDRCQAAAFDEGPSRLRRTF